MTKSGKAMKMACKIQKKEKVSRKTALRKAWKKIKAKDKTIKHRAKVVRKAYKKRKKTTKKSKKK